MSTFQERLKIVLEEKNVKAADLARGTGLTRSAISKILSNGNRKVHADTALKIANYLKVDPSWLYGLKDEREPSKLEKIHNLFQQLSELGKDKVIEFAEFILNSENKNKWKDD